MAGGRELENPFTQLPNDVLLEISRYLIPEDILLFLYATFKREATYTPNEDNLWREKVKLHFSYKGKIAGDNWLATFKDAYTNRYKSIKHRSIEDGFKDSYTNEIHAPQRKAIRSRLFSIVKEDGPDLLEKMAEKKQLILEDFLCGNDYYTLESDLRGSNNQALKDYCYEHYFKLMPLGQVLVYAITQNQPLEEVKRLLRSDAQHDKQYSYARRRMRPAELAARYGHLPVLEYLITNHPELQDVSFNAAMDGCNKEAIAYFFNILRQEDNVASKVKAFFAALRVKNYQAAYEMLSKGEVSFSDIATNLYDKYLLQSAIERDGNLRDQFRDFFRKDDAESELSKIVFIGLSRVDTSSVKIVKDKLWRLPRAEKLVKLHNLIDYAVTKREPSMLAQLLQVDESLNKDLMAMTNGRGEIPFVPSMNFTSYFCMDVERDRYEAIGYMLQWMNDELFSQRISDDDSRSLLYMLIRQEGSDPVLEKVLEIKPALANSAQRNDYAASIPPLHCVFEMRGKSDTSCITKIKLLVEAGANVNQVDNRGKTVLEKAIDGGFAGCVRYLIQHGARLPITQNPSDQSLLCTVLKSDAQYRLNPQPWRHRSSWERHQKIAPILLGAINDPARRACATLVARYITERYLDKREYKSNLFCGLFNPLFAHPKKQKIAAADMLLNGIVEGKDLQSIDKEYIGALTSGELGRVYHYCLNRLAANDQHEQVSNKAEIIATYFSLR